MSDEHPNCENCYKHKKAVMGATESPENTKITYSPPLEERVYELAKGYVRRNRYKKVDLATFAEYLVEEAKLITKEKI